MPRLLRHTLRTLNHAIRPVDQLLAPRPWTDAPPLFLLGSPRSGTTIAYQLIASAFRVTYLPRALNLTPGLTHVGFRILRSKLGRPPSGLHSDRGRTPGMLGPSEAIGFWTPWLDERGPLTGGLNRGEDALAKAVYQLQGHLHSPLLVKCLYLVQSLDLIATALPHARFIYINRAPVPTIASLFQARSNTTGTWWSVRPPGVEHVSTLSLLDQSVWQHFAVNAMVRKALSTVENERWQNLKYEDLCRNPNEQLNRLSRWLIPHGWKNRPNWKPPSLAPSNRVSAELEREIRKSPEFKHD